MTNSTRHALFALCLLLPMTAMADVAVPALKARVTDLTGTLSAEQAAQLEQRLTAFEQQKGSQIAVLLLPTTEPETIEQYGIRVAEAWKLGRKGVDDGALLLIAKEDRALRIEVGYGLEGALPDAIAKRIIDETVTPFLRDGNYFGGINAGIEQMIGVVSGEALPPPKSTARGESNISNAFGLVFFAALFIGQLLRSMFGRLPGALIGGLAIGGIAWLLMQLLLPAILAAVFTFVLVLLGLGGGGFGGLGGIGGGGRRGGFGGGGFSGGGGGFGGGGASGRF